MTQVWLTTFKFRRRERSKLKSANILKRRKRSAKSKLKVKVRFSNQIKKYGKKLSLNLSSLGRFNLCAASILWVKIVSSLRKRDYLRSALFKPTETAGKNLRSKISRVILLPRFSGWPHSRSTKSTTKSKTQQSLSTELKLVSPKKKVLSHSPKKQSFWRLKKSVWPSFQRLSMTLRV